MGSNKAFSLLTLPTELIKDIIDHFDVNETATLRTMCRLLRTLAAPHYFRFSLKLPDARSYGINIPADAIPHIRFLYIPQRYDYLSFVPTPITNLQIYPLVYLRSLFKNSPHLHTLYICHPLELEQYEEIFRNIKRLHCLLISGADTKRLPGHVLSILSSQVDLSSLHLFYISFDTASEITTVFDNTVIPIADIVKQSGSSLIYFSIVGALFSDTTDRLAESFRYCPNLMYVKLSESQNVPVKLICSILQTSFKLIELETAQVIFSAQSRAELERTVRTASCHLRCFEIGGWGEDFSMNLTGAACFASTEDVFIKNREICPAAIAWLMSLPAVKSLTFCETIFIVTKDYRGLFARAENITLIDCQMELETLGTILESAPSLHRLDFQNTVLGNEFVQEGLVDDELFEKQNPNAEYLCYEKTPLEYLRARIAELTDTPLKFSEIYGKISCVIDGDEDEMLDRDEDSIDEEDIGEDMSERDIYEDTKSTSESEIETKYDKGEEVECDVMSDEEEETVEHMEENFAWIWENMEEAIEIRKFEKGRQEKGEHEQDVDDDAISCGEEQVYLYRDNVDTDMMSYKRGLVYNTMEETSDNSLVYEFEGGSDHWEEVDDYAASYDWENANDSEQDVDPEEPQSSSSEGEYTRGHLEMSAQTEKEDDNSDDNGDDDDLSDREFRPKKRAHIESESDGECSSGYEDRVTERGKLARPRLYIRFLASMLDADMRKEDGRKRRRR